MEKIKKFRHKEIIIFSLIMFGVYLFTASCSFDDQDSIHFIKGVKEFDVSKNQPHPPGFPVYIFFGKISSLFFQDEVLSLTFLSAIFGALTLLVFYFLVLEMFDKKIALMSAVLLSVTALFWLFALKAMADATALFFAILSLVFIYKFTKSKKNKHLYVASFVSAISAGVRLHTIFLLLPLLIYCYFKSKNKKTIFYNILIFSFGILIWLVPMILINGGEKYFHKSFNLFFRRYKNPRLEKNIIKFILRRVKDFFLLLFIGLGINPFKINFLFLTPVLTYFFFLILSFRKIKKKDIFISIGLAFYFLLYFSVLFSKNPRYLLIFIPFLCVLFVLGTFWFEKYQTYAFVILLLMTLALSLPLAFEIRKNPSPIVQAINFTKTNYNISEVNVYNEINLIQHLSYYGLKNRPTPNKTNLYFTPFRYSSENTDLTLIKSFKRNPLVHYKHSVVNLYEVNNDEFLKNN